MNSRDKQWEYLLGWMIAYALVGALFIYAVIHFPTLNDIACAADDGDLTKCFREWVSATGGWAALAAAIPTVWILNQQVKQTAEQHRIGLHFNGLAVEAAARRALTLIDIIQVQVNGCCIKPTQQCAAATKNFSEVQKSILEEIEKSLQQLGAIEQTFSGLLASTSAAVAMVQQAKHRLPNGGPLNILKMPGEEWDAIIRAREEAIDFALRTAYDVKRSAEQILRFREKFANLGDIE